MVERRVTCTLPRPSKQVSTQNMYFSPWGCTCTYRTDGYGHDDGVGQHIIYQHIEHSASMMYEKYVQAKEDVTTSHTYH